MDNISLKNGVLDMTLNCISWWIFGPGDLGMYSTSSLSLILDALWPGGLVPVKVQYINQISLFENYLYSFSLGLLWFYGIWTRVSYLIPTLVYSYVLDVYVL